MNLDLFIKRNHIFKKRITKSNYNNIYNIIKHDNNSGLYILKKIKFELVYLRTIRQVFKKRRIYKQTPRFNNSRYWTFICPNFILTMKAKNSRMGAGVGSFVRVLQIIRPGKALVITQLYTEKFLIKARKYIMFKLKIHLYLKLQKFLKLKLIV